MEDDKKATRRRYSAEFKAQVLAECSASGASVAKVAMAHGINDNVVHSWRRLARDKGATLVKTNEFVPVAMTAAPLNRAEERRIEVELRRGPVMVKITWPLSAAVEFGTWTRELLR